MTESSFSHIPEIEKENNPLEILKTPPVVIPLSSTTELASEKSFLAKTFDKVMSVFRSQQSSEREKVADYLEVLRRIEKHDHELGAKCHALRNLAHGYPDDSTGKILKIASNAENAYLQCYREKVEEMNQVLKDETNKSVSELSKADARALHDQGKDAVIALAKRFLAFEREMAEIKKSNHEVLSSIINFKERSDGFLASITEKGLDLEKTRKAIRGESILGASKIKDIFEQKRDEALSAVLESEAFKNKHFEGIKDSLAKVLAELNDAFAFSEGMKEEVEKIYVAQTENSKIKRGLADHIDPIDKPELVKVKASQKLFTTLSEWFAAQESRMLKTGEVGEKAGIIEKFSVIKTAEELEAFKPSVASFEKGSKESRDMVSRIGEQLHQFNSLDDSKVEQIAGKKLSKEAQKIFENEIITILKSDLSTEELNKKLNDSLSRAANTISLFKSASEKFERAHQILGQLTGRVEGAVMRKGADITIEKVRVDIANKLKGSASVEALNKLAENLILDLEDLERVNSYLSEIKISVGLDAELPRKMLAIKRVVDETFDVALDDLAEDCPDRLSFHRAFIKTLKVYGDYKIQMTEMNAHGWYEMSEEHLQRFMSGLDNKLKEIDFLSSFTK
jgi:hypothetical protein